MNNILLLLSIPTVLAGETNESSKEKIVVSKGHLVKDIINLFGVWVESFTSDEVDFQYFAAHDLDNNEKLDGLELFRALVHHTSEDEENDEEHDTREEKILSDKEEDIDTDPEAQVDAVLLEYDKNNDGFLDYKEFRKVKKSHPDINKQFSQENNTVLLFKQ